MPTWNDKAYSAIVEKHPALESKPESVALAVWALTQNKNMTPDDWRELSEKTGVKVAGRAVGSAREIVGITPSKKKAGRRGAKNAPSTRGPGRPRKTASASALGDISAMIKAVEQERDRAVTTLTKIRDLIDSAV